MIAPCGSLIVRVVLLRDPSLMIPLSNPLSKTMPPLLRSMEPWASLSTFKTIDVSLSGGSLYRSFHNTQCRPKWLGLPNMVHESIQLRGLRNLVSYLEYPIHVLSCIRPRAKEAHFLQGRNRRDSDKHGLCRGAFHDARSVRAVNCYWSA